MADYKRKNWIRIRDLPRQARLGRRLIWKANGGEGLRMTMEPRAKRRNAARADRALSGWPENRHLVMLVSGEFYKPYPFLNY